MVYLGQVKAPTLNFWYSICLDIDTVRETMDTAINGMVTSQDVEIGEGVAEKMPRQLQGNLVVGKWNYTFTGVEEQFVWAIAKTFLKYFTHLKELFHFLQINKQKHYKTEF